MVQVPLVGRTQPQHISMVYKHDHDGEVVEAHLQRAAINATRDRVKQCRTLRGNVVARRWPLELVLGGWADC